jgi:hypothetical protein
MKPILRQYNLLALLAASCVGMAAAADLPVSRTGGSVSVSLPVGQTTLLSLPLVEIVASGTVASTGGGNTITLTSSPASLPDVLTNPHAIKITSRATHVGGANAYGLTAIITGQATQTVTAALLATPNAGDEFIIYRLETFNSLFGATNTVGLKGGSSVTSADIIYTDDGAGSLVGYFYRTGANAWRLVSAPAGANQNPTILPNRGLLVVRRTGGTAVTLNFSGDAMIGKEAVDVVNNASNIINNPFTTQTTLLDSRLKDFVNIGSSSTSADIIYLENAGVLTGYFYRTGVNQWKLVSAPAGADQGATVITPGKALLVVKRAAGEFTFEEPFTE